MKTVVAIDQDRGEVLRLASELSGEYHILHCPEPERALGVARGRGAKAILLDLEPRVVDSLALLGTITGTRDAPPVIVHTARRDPRAAFEAARRGATAWLAKPCRAVELASAIRAALEPGIEAPLPFVGGSALILAAQKLLRTYAPSPYPVLILGESGTGKELAAAALHELSGRKGRFVSRNCATFPGELVESELFGAERGAYTGAVARPGAFELAVGGTIFLDEIGEATPSFMPRLLRVLETGEYWRLGGRTALRADARLVSATSRDLRADTRDGRFRADLLFRIDTLVLELPPLRDRRDDIPDLARHFLLGASGGRKRMDEAALGLLADAPWPGNVRQLRNVVQRAAVLSGPREEIGVEEISF